ncbi:hypothetical protein CEUSTIGMA_g10316.t1 [Chlamydomonas eustigma]|uniref:PSI domain-containing protein n=1 Tax=Chlamydomonas eustigma TaxID=1157962 RepID=A0A250XJB3_9CHLO|nr:hypothetical protein CEUSTIGMA_g10316.t1 [Chlamydomonas eustigma]|eukprot:GAX82890.1 hypothetical protein CEUSTIGMA_g10316.t1 [Chlamydomonas eustigma]
MNVSRILFEIVFILSIVAQAPISALNAQKSGLGKIGKRSPQAECFDQASKGDCNECDECVWCTSSTSLSGTCYPMASIRYLPKRYTCDVRISTAAADSVCDGLPESSCVSPDCVWCKSAAVGSKCYSKDEAKLLPKAIFTCKVSPDM